MKGLYLVEPVVALYAFCSFLIYPLVQQYVYRRLWQELTNTTYPISDNTSRCAPHNSSNQSDFHEVQRQASLFSLYSELLSTIPSLVVTLMVVAYSDRGGRKTPIILPLVGTLLYTLSFLTVSFFELNVYLLIGASLLSSLFGGLGTFLGGCFSYISDLCEDGRQKTLRMAGLDMMIGLLSGVASISTGYFVRAAGFNWPFLVSALGQCFIILYAVFILEETVKKPQMSDGDILDSSLQPSAIKQMVFGVYGMFARASCRSKTVLSLLMVIFTSFSFIYMGAISLITLYELNEPLCWTEIYIGYGSALSTTVFLISFVGVFLLTYCGVPQLLIVLLGIISVASGMILVSFAKTTLLMFVARVPMLLAIMPFPVLRSMMSKIISKSEQGALFAWLSFLESLTGNVSSAAYNSVYAATVSWYPGFAFQLSAGLTIIPFSVLGVVAVVGVDDPKEVKRQEPVCSEDENPVEDQNDNSPLLG